MSFFVVRLVRSLPLIIAMAVAAVVIYLVVSYRRSPARAKEVLIKIFTVINGFIVAFFGLASLYALFEDNLKLFDIIVCFAIVGVAGLAITLWCRYLFLKHNPSYRKKPVKVKVKRRWPWSR